MTKFEIVSGSGKKKIFTDFFDYVTNNFFLYSRA